MRRESVIVNFVGVLEKREPSVFNMFWISAFAGMIISQ